MDALFPLGRDVSNLPFRASFQCPLSCGILSHELHAKISPYNPYFPESTLPSDPCCALPHPLLSKAAFIGAVDTPSPPSIPFPASMHPPWCAEVLGIMGGYIYISSSVNKRFPSLTTRVPLAVFPGKKLVRVSGLFIYSPQLIPNRTI